MTKEDSVRPILETLPRDISVPFSVPATLMDEVSYGVVQMPDLYDAVNTTTTRSGSLVLARSFRQPHTSLDLIRAKQEAVDELGSNSSLKSNVSEFLEKAARAEEDFYSLIHGTYGLRRDQHPNLYDIFKGSRRFLKFLANGVGAITPESRYLTNIVSELGGFSETEVFDWVENPIFLTPRGIRNKKNAPWYLPKRTFHPTDYKPDFYIGASVATTVVGGVMLGGMVLGMEALSNLILPSGESTLSSRMLAGVPSMITAINAFMLPTLYMANAPREFDKDNVITKVGDHFFGNRDVALAIDNLGKLDEIAALADYGKRIGGVLPRVSDQPKHHFSAKGFKNPLLVVTNPDYVPNDIDLRRLTFITGPVSGGKTSLCKAVAQAQVLAQIGAPIPAMSADIAIADQVSYQVPMEDGLRDPEGRFGTEAIRARDVFYPTTPRSLRIMDELLEATTHAERVEHLKDILDGYWSIGNNTVLVTHNHELVRIYEAEGRGQFLQVEFDGKIPTHKIIPGISTVSHSSEVLERIGFSKADIQRHLREKGYIQ